MEPGLYDNKHNLIHTWGKLINYGLIKVDNNEIIRCDNKIMGKLVIDEKINKISSFAFEKCGLDLVVFKSDVEKIPYSCFFCNESLNKIILKNVKTIERYAFHSCINLYDINLNDNITGIYEHAFYNCGLTGSLKMPKDLKVIGARAFCSNDFYEIILHNNIECIGKSAFADCKNLKSIIYNGTKEDFLSIANIEDLFTTTGLKMENIQFQKSLEELIDEGYSLMEANKEFKKQQKTER